MEALRFPARPNATCHSAVNGDEHTKVRELSTTRTTNATTTSSAATTTMDNNNKKLEGVRYTAELRSLSKRVLALKHTDSNAADNVKSHLSADTLPLSSLKAMRTIIKQKCNESESVKTNLLADLNAALVAATESSPTTDQTQARGGGGLQFTAPPTKPSPDQLTAEEVKYQRRIERLRLKAEENRYSRLVNNLDTKKADDETMKSMTYATSVGMNMIVAPISFGAFMYFFSGQLFGWVLDKDDDGASRNNNNVDIRAVIAGVISGVIMLFIEMTLFVIRSHEMDAAVSKKAKKRQVNPFGYDKRTAARTFEG